jgi:cold shock protein
MDGIVKWFHAKKGYGFISGADGNDYFASYADIDSREQYKMLNETDKVTFEVEKQDKTKVKTDKAVKIKTTNANEKTNEAKNDDTIY